MNTTQANIADQYDLARYYAQWGMVDLAVDQQLHAANLSSLERAARGLAD